MERYVRCGKLAGGMFDTQLTDVLADRAAELPAEDAAQVSRMHADSLCYVVKAQTFVKSRMEQISGSDEPAGGFIALPKAMGGG